MADATAPPSENPRAQDKDRSSSPLPTEDALNAPPSPRSTLKRHDVTNASYPLPQALSHRLQEGVVLLGPNGAVPKKESSNKKPTTVLRDGMEESLKNLVGNSIEAIDQMYFAAPPRLRQHPAFQHRLCLRVCANTTDKTLSLTDLGAGMTRADLINSLGIGRAGLASRTSRKPTTDRPAEEDETTEEEEETDDDDDGEEEQGEGETDEDEEEEEEEEEEESDPQAMDTEDEEQVFDCRSIEIGGFYAALCALGTGIRVGTKSKFDDYYEFQVGTMSDQQENNETDLKSFCIRRPGEEGVQIAVETGYDKFSDVRGDSGTCITIRLNDAAIRAGFLDEAKLETIFLEIVQTTRYTVAFSTGGQAEEIIQASAKEAQALAELENSQKDASALDAVADLELGSAARADDTSRLYNSVKERAKYIPLRLSLGERKMLRLVEASMVVSDYTTSVDIPFKTTTRRTHEQLKGITSVLRGLVTACDYKAGQKLLKDDDYAEYEKFFRQMFEIARRYKINNPEKMRVEYGKLIYLLQDAVSPSLAPHLGFSVKGPIESVYKFLEERGGLALLEDPSIETATQEVLALKKTRPQIERELRAKERAVAVLKKKYSNRNLSVDDIHNCLYSICDNNSFLNSNRVPVDKVIDFLTSHFSPTKIEEGYSLSIISGEDGARLSHSHERQYYFALQSLTLWRDIIDDMFRLWAMAEEDLLSESVTYSLQDTGQGMQRVQQCPRTYKAMQTVLTRVQAKVNHWVGSSVIHMADHNVPNSLIFIDKYTQVPRILGPIVTCLENLEKICEKDDGIRKMVENGFGGVDKVRQDILYDFFKSAFDGSGAESFYDAGSCIDGRMTSAWNWCAQIQSKPYYPIFKLTGFVGFDGEFK